MLYQPIQQNQEVRAQALATFKQQIALCSAYQAKMIATETGSVSVGYTKKIY